MAKPGPKTEAGKKIVSLNAVKHGVFSTTPVIPGIEREEDWEAHRAGVLESLHPEGHLETILTERIATLLWRLQRVVRYETEGTAVELKGVEEDYALERSFMPPAAGDIAALYHSDVVDHLKYQRERLSLLEGLPKLADDASLSGDDAASILWAVASEAGVDPEQFEFSGVPDDLAAEDFTGWTAKLVRQGMADLATQGGRDLPDLLATALGNISIQVLNLQQDSNRMARRLDAMRSERILPSDKTLDKVMRYEAHLNRQLNQTLHELEALQVRRQGGVAPLARLDVQGLPDA